MLTVQGRSQTKWKARYFLERPGPKREGRKQTKRDGDGGPTKNKRYIVNHGTAHVEINGEKVMQTVSRVFFANFEARERYLQHF